VIFGIKYITIMLNVKKYRKEFPVTESYIYLDHAGVAPIPLRVKDTVQSLLNEYSEQGVFAYEKWMDRVEDVRSDFSFLLGCRSEEIAFVKSTSHGISLIANGLQFNEGDNILIYEKEFPSNVYPWLNLEKKGVEIRTLSFRNGKVELEDIKNGIDSKTKMISISSVQHSNGFKADLRKLGEFCKSKNIYFFVDAIQSLGVEPMDVREFNIDFLAADGHKWLLAPEGTGIFYCKEELLGEINPVLIGWNSVVNEREYDKINFTLKDDARRFEEGSPSIIGILALGQSLKFLLEVGIENINKRVLSLGSLVIEKAEKAGFIVRTPENIEERAGIISFGSEFDPSEIREKLFKDNVLINYRDGALRVAPHFYNTEEEIELLFNKIDVIVKELKD